MRKIINIAVVLGAVFCLVGVALARTVWLPEYEEKFEGMDSCAAHGMLSAVEKDEKNLTCLNSQFIQWVGICYKNCKCKFEWTKEKCESKIGGVWRVSGRSCDDGTYVYWEDCVNSACDNRVDNLINPEWGCKEYWEDCPSKCKIPYPDNCHNREDVRKDENDVCVKFWEDCKEKCEDKITCKQKDCSDYPLTQRPNNAVSVGECMIECGDYTPRYKIVACEEGYEMNADKTDCVCKDNKCAEKCFIRENKDDDNVAEWAGDSCSAGCGDNTVSYYKINKCKDLFTTKTDGNDCITDCMCESTESCDGYLLPGNAERPDEEVEHAEGYDKCTPDCGKTWKYKVIACDEGYEMNADKTDCVCKDNECDKQCFIHSTNTGVDGAVWAVDSCSVGCGEDKDTTWYKIDGCEGLLTAERDINNCITGCTCKSTESCDEYPLSGDANGPTSRVKYATKYASCTPNCGDTWKWKVTECILGYNPSEDGKSCDPDCIPNSCEGYTVAANERIANASYEECNPGCDGDTMYKLNGCNETFIAKTDDSDNITACECPDNAEFDEKTKKCVCKGTFIEEIDDSGNMKCVCTDDAELNETTKECKCPDNYTLTWDNKKCLTSCAVGIYNEGHCYISTEVDGETDLSGLKNISCGGVVYVDGTVRLSSANTAELKKSNWDGKTFTPCDEEKEGHLAFSSVGTNVADLQGSMTFKVGFGKTNTQGTIKITGTNITFEKGFSIEELEISGNNTFIIKSTDNDNESNQIQKVLCPTEGTLVINLVEDARVEIENNENGCDVQICKDGSCTKAEGKGIYGG